jgi:potassium-dependent mechanosensitive channel
MGLRSKICMAIAVLMLTSGLASAQQTQPQVQAPALPQPSLTAPVVPPVPAAPVVVVPTPPPLPSEVLEPIKRLSENIETAEKSIQQLKELEGELQRLRGDVERIIYESTAAAESLRPQLAEVKSQIEKLGPVPAAGQPPESPTVVSERLRLNTLAGALDGAVKTSELAWVRAKQLIDRITVMRYQLFTRNLFERRQSPMLPALWQDVGNRMESVANRSRYYGGDWMGWAQKKSGALWLLLSGVALLLAIAAYLKMSLVARVMARPAEPPTFFARVVLAAWRTPAYMLAPAVAAMLTYATLDNLDLLYGPWDAFGTVVLKGALLLIAASALTTAVLAPRHPWWRLVPISDATAARLSLFIKAFVGVYVLDNILTDFGRVIYVPLSITVAQAFITSCIFAALLAALLLTPFAPQVGADRPVNGHAYDAQPAPVSRHRPLWLKAPLWLIGALIIGSAMFGYIALARFTAQQLVMSGVVLTTVGLLYLAIRATTRGREDGKHVLGEFLGKGFGLDGVRQIQISRLVELAMSLALVLLAVPVLLLQWGFSGAEIRDWSKSLLFGFEIGGFKISLARILLGVMLFIFLLFMTRLVQRILRERFIHQQRVDTGVANSVDTAVGYGGIILAALISVSFAGFDITNLAIVAGALSVGIGFGLQSIVNNFVSGLILLVERPIKVGDWVVLGDMQGNVRRISVRSTEIETFDRASLIVPNSELISGRVLNWTHRNMLGRVVIKISVDPTADPQKVINLLLAAANNQANLLRQPEPVAGLDFFGSDRLDFSLRATLADVNAGGRVQSDLRLAILQACRSAGLIASMRTAFPEVAAAVPSQSPQSQAPQSPALMPAAPAAQPSGPLPVAATAQASGQVAAQPVAPFIAPPPPVRVR